MNPVDLARLQAQHIVDGGGDLLAQYEIGAVDFPPLIAHEVDELLSRRAELRPFDVFKARS
jgi:hypothetical protein